MTRTREVNVGTYYPLGKVGKVQYLVGQPSKCSEWVGSGNGQTPNTGR